MTNISARRYILFFATFLAMPVSHAALRDVGDVEFARGTVAARVAGEQSRVLNKGADVYLGDNIQTIDRSFAVLKLDQGDKLTVRPNSSLSLENPSPIKLFKGGVRASSEMTASGPMEIQVGKSKIKTQSAAFSVRVCGNDCAGEENKLAKARSQKETLVVARVTQLKGNVAAINKVKEGASPRPLGVASPLYRQDRLTSGHESHALIAFRDKGKLTLQENSVLDISQYQFKDPGKEDVADYKLVKGGLRVLTGIIGKADKDAFQVKTPVATMGIRGTGFDLLCQGDCIGEGISRKNKGFEQIILGKAEGLYTHVWQGVITQTNASGTHELKEGESSYIANDRSRPEPMPGPPPGMKDNPAPRPDKEPGTADQGKSGVLATLEAEATSTTEISDPTSSESPGPVTSETPSTDISTSGEPTVSAPQVTESPQATEGIEPGASEPVPVQRPDTGEAEVLATLEADTTSPDTRVVSVADEADVEPISEATLFETTTLDGVPPGVYVTVHEGDVTLITEEGVINIGTEETGYIAADDTAPVRLEEQVVFQTQDPFPSPDTFNAEQAEIGEFSLLADSVEPNIVDTGFVCEIQ